MLLEGIHCTGIIPELDKSKKIIVRLHNDECEYYKQLANHETNLFKKLYYRNESKLLKNYEQTIANTATLLALSKQDADVYQQVFKAPNVYFLPVFLPYTLAVGKEGKGCYCLYHGNLAINENEKAAIWLLENVFSKLKLPFVITGKNPSEKLQKLAHDHQHTCLVANPTDKELQDMIGKAHVHVLPSFNNTGVKIKLLNAIFNGRHCVVNKAGVEGSGLESFCHLAEDAATFIQQIEELYKKAFTEQEVQDRQRLLQTMYNNEANAKKLMAFLWKRYPKPCPFPS